MKKKTSKVCIPLRILIISLAIIMLLLYGFYEQGYHDGVKSVDFEQVNTGLFNKYAVYTPLIGEGVFCDHKGLIDCEDYVQNLGNGKYTCFKQNTTCYVKR